MAALRASARVLAALAAAALLLWFAALIDLLGTVSNLVADVLIGSAIVLVVRAVLLRRARAAVVDEVSQDRSHGMEAVREFAQEIELAARGLFAASTLHGNWSDPMFVLNEEGFHWRCDYLRANLRVLAGHHGGLDLGRHLEAMIARSSRMWPLVQGVRAAAGTHDADRSVIERLPEELHDIVSDLRRLEALIGDSYDPRGIAVLRHPDQFPTWLRRLFWVFGVTAGVAWGAFYLLPGTIPRSVADGTTNNVLTAGAAALVGAALAFVAQTSIRRRKIRSAHPYFLAVVRACYLLGAWLEGNVRGDAEELLGLVAEAIDRNVERLQHILPDPLASRYKRDLLAEIGQFPARPGGPASSHGPDSATSAAGMSVERRLRLEATMDVMLDRVITVYSDTESFMNLREEEILPAELFSDDSNLT
jgi:hypothetical protein